MTDAPRRCGCDCDKTPSPGRRFVSGHDAKVAHKLAANHGSMTAFWEWYHVARQDDQRPADSR